MSTVSVAIILKRASKVYYEGVSIIHTHCNSVKSLLSAELTSVLFTRVGIFTNVGTSTVSFYIIVPSMCISGVMVLGDHCGSGRCGK